MKEIEIEWCPTKDMVADFMTKPLQGSHFRRLRDLIMGMTKVDKSKTPSKNTYTEIKKDTQGKVKRLKRDIVRKEATVRPDSPTSVALMA
jgi:hypothetical protein